MSRDQYVRERDEYLQKVAEDRKKIADAAVPMKIAVLSKKYQRFVCYDPTSDEHYSHPKRVVENDVCKFFVERLTTEGDEVIDQFWVKHNKLPYSISAYGAPPPTGLKLTLEDPLIRKISKLLADAQHGLKNNPRPQALIANVVLRLQELNKTVDDVKQPIGLDAMPESALASTRLGDLWANLFQPNDWCLDMALPALVTAASVLVPELIYTEAGTSMLLRGDDQMVTLYTGLIAPVHSGKSQVTEWAAKALGIFAEGKTGEHYFEVKTGSAEQMVSTLSKHMNLKTSALITPDEWSHLFAKANIPDASFPSFMTSTFYRRRQTFTRPNNKEVTLNLALSFIGGIVEADFDTVFNAATLGGLYDRFLFGRAPDGFVWSYRPYQHMVATRPSCEPVAVLQDGSLFEVIKHWNKTHPHWGRIIEVCARIATIYASMDGRKTVTGADLEKLEGLAAYQFNLRGKFKPNEGMIPDAVFANAACNWINTNAHDWTHIGELKHHTHAYELKLGPNVAERALLGAARSGRIDLWMRYNRNGIEQPLPSDYVGRTPQVGLVRRAR